MKHLLVLAGVVVGFATPLSLRSAPAPSVDGGRSGHWLVRTEVVGKGVNRAIYYYTNVVLTGSHIPVVLRRYKGQLEIVNGGLTQGTAYSIGDLGNTGGNDVAGTLSHLDPSVSVR